MILPFGHGDCPQAIALHSPFFLLNDAQPWYFSSYHNLATLLNLKTTGIRVILGENF